MRSTRIAIECRSEDHPGRVVKIALLEPDERGRWEAVSAGDRNCHFNLDHLSYTVLDGVEPALDGSRWVFDWRCKLCSRHACLRGERIDAVLDRIAEAGLSTVRLKHFL